MLTKKSKVLAVLVAAIFPGGQPRLLNLSAEDKAALVAFLKTLTDRAITSDVKFSNPFK